MTIEAVSEFSFLAGQAQALGVDAEPMTRVAVPAGDGRTVSALKYTTDEPIVTLLHGAGLNAHTWDATVLSMGLPALAIDLPGHGDSSWRDDAMYSPSNLADDVIVALDALTSRPQILVGHSLGGLTAAAIAARRPDLVERIVFVDIVPALDPRMGPAELRAFYSKQDFVSRDEAVDYAMGFGMGGDREGTARGVLFNTRIRDDGRVEWKHHFARLALTILPEGAAEGTLVQNEQSWQNFEAITAPMTLVRGAHGYIDESALHTFAHRIPRAAIETLDAGHNVQETQPVALGAIIAATTDTD
ncbi:alpha/beta fold hydrolase [Microbacterium sp. NC79]|uniref:alpha/beta fold hydrolase n=1 Tax=Microbacterium sp. NC79 TaxID=2851009 RepID=UPI00349F78B4